MKTELKWDKTLGCQLPCTDYIGVTIFQLFGCRWNKYRYRYDDGRYTAIWIYIYIYTCIWFASSALCNFKKQNTEKVATEKTCKRQCIQTIFRVDIFMIGAYVPLCMSCTISTRLRNYIKDVVAYCKKHGLVKSPGHDRIGILMCFQGWHVSKSLPVLFCCTMWPSPGMISIAAKCSSTLSSMRRAKPRRRPILRKRQPPALARHFHGLIVHY